MENQQKTNQNNNSSLTAALLFIAGSFIGFGHIYSAIRRDLEAAILSVTGLVFTPIIFLSSLWIFLTGLTLLFKLNNEKRGVGVAQFLLAVVLILVIFKYLFG